MKRRLLILLILIAVSGCAFTGQTLKFRDSSDTNLPGTYEETISWNGLDRTYLVHVPACIQDNRPLPVVLMFHGGGGTAKGVSRDTGWIEKADQDCFIVIFPDGVPPDPQKPSSFTTNPQAWNDGSGRFNQDIDDVGFIAMILESVIQEFRVDPGRIYAAGFSNGASLAFLVGIELNETIAAIALVAGALWVQDFALESPVSLLYITGTEDPLNPIDGGVPGLAIGDGEPGGGKAKPPVDEGIQRWTEALACEIQPEILASSGGIVRTHFSRCRDSAEVVYYTLEGVGHHWPGGKVRFPEMLVGKSTDLMNATEGAWDFFQDHPKP